MSHDTITVRASKSYYFALMCSASPKNSSQMTVVVLTHLNTQVSKDMPEFKGPQKARDQSHGTYEDVPP